MKDEEDGGRGRLLGVLLARCGAEEDGEGPVADGDSASSLRRRTEIWRAAGGGGQTATAGLGAGNGTLPVLFFLVTALDWAAGTYWAGVGEAARECK
jgi:hypothetical protein